MEIYRPAPILVKLLDETLNLILAELLAERAKRHLQLFGLDCAGAARVEQVEGVLDLLLLRLGQVLLSRSLLLPWCSTSRCRRYLPTSPIAKLVTDQKFAYRAANQSKTYHFV